MPIHGENFQFDAAGLKLNALLHGERTQPPIVLLHGYMDHAHAWDFVAEILAERFFVIAPDFRGFGDSAWDPDGYMLVNYQIDIAALWKSLALTTAAVVGHSMGGNVASQWAGTFPERVSKLVLVEGFGPPNHDIAENPIRTRQWLEGLLNKPRVHPRKLSSIEEAAARLEETSPLLTPERALLLARHATRPDGEEWVWKFDPAHRLPSPHPYREEEFACFWKRITAPVLALHGEHGPIPVEAMAPRYSFISKLATATISGAGHSIHIEQPELLAQKIEEFLGEPTQTAG